MRYAALLFFVGGIAFSVAAAMSGSAWLVAAGLLCLVAGVAAGVRDRRSSS